MDAKTKKLVQSWKKEADSKGFKLNQIYFCMCEQCKKLPTYERVVLAVEVVCLDNDKGENDYPFPQEQFTIEGLRHTAEDVSRETIGGENVSRKGPDKNSKQGGARKGNWRYYKERAIRNNCGKG